MSRPSNAVLNAALDYARRGWHVFPLRPGDKRPAFPDHDASRCEGRDARCANGHQSWEARATTDPARIERAWTARPFNIGIACGPSGLVVVDLDLPKPGKPGQAPPPGYDQPGVRDGADVLAMLCEALDQPLPVDTYAVRTGSGGTHLYYAAPAGVTLRNTSSQLGWLIDTRAHGGYVVAAGSTVAGNTYTEIVADVDPSPLPGWLTERLTTSEPAPHTADPHRAAGDASLGVGGTPSAYIFAALRGELDRVLTAPEGRRNHALNAAAFCLGQLVGAGMLSRHLAEDALTLAGQAAGLGVDTPGEIERSIRSGLDSGERTPRRPAA